MMEVYLFGWSQEVNKVAVPNECGRESRLSSWEGMLERKEKIVKIEIRDQISGGGDNKRGEERDGLVRRRGGDLR
jgi:hypothetical protein